MMEKLVAEALRIIIPVITTHPFVHNPYEATKRIHEIIEILENWSTEPLETPPSFTPINTKK